MKVLLTKFTKIEVSYMINSNTLFSSFNKDELVILSQLKRLFERLQCDSELLSASHKNEIRPDQLKRLKEIGIKLDLSEFPLEIEKQQDLALYLLAVSREKEEELDNYVKKLAAGYPLIQLWGRYLAFISKKRFNNTRIDDELPTPLSSKFTAWRKRRIAATLSELGFFGKQISHPSFAYELSDGCSVGCWFCSFAVQKLTGVLDYYTERENVLSIVKHNIDLFGKKTAGNALPYYRSEPHDNPGYINFMRDFEEQTCEVMCTATAVCGDIDWLRDLMKFYRRKNARYSWPRLSILSLGMMDKVHDAFSPMELLDIEFLIQSKDHVRPKVTGGRILEDNAGLRDKEDFSDRDNIGYVPQGSIACVSGFNISLVPRTIMLFSPSYAGSRWPHGFRVFGQATYNDESDYPEAIKRLVDRCMYLSPPKDKIIKFRDDIVFRPTETGFDLATPNQIHHFKSKEKYGPLGDMISSGNYTCEELINELIKKHKANPIILHAIVQNLFNEGYLDEIYDE